jgi:hypothetical protein
MRELRKGDEVPGVHREKTGLGGDVVAEDTCLLSVSDTVLTRSPRPSTSSEEHTAIGATIIKLRNTPITFLTGSILLQKQSFSTRASHPKGPGFKG